MRDRIRGFGLVALLAVALACSVGACASSSEAGSGDATKLLQHTFSGAHTVSSGNLRFTVTINPSGSSTVTQPVVLSISGPFQSQGKGKLPKSDLTITLSAQGKTASIGVLSTGSKGYLVAGGDAYQLPDRTYRQLESTFAALASSPASGSASGSGTLASLGIDPLRWLIDPSVAGTAEVGGAQTTHIHAAVNVKVLLDDLNTLLQKASSLGAVAGSALNLSISPATRAQLAGSVRNPSVDVWTGTTDKTVRRLTIRLTVPVSGAPSMLLGGLRSAAITIDLLYTDLNQPQTITGPAVVQPFSAFGPKAQSLLAPIESALLGGMTFGASGWTSSAGGASIFQIPGSSGAAVSGSAARVQSYGQCVSAAGADNAKMQKCASLLTSK